MSKDRTPEEDSPSRDVEPAKARAIIEAILMTASEPVTPGRLVHLLSGYNGRDIREAIDALNAVLPCPNRQFVFFNNMSGALDPQGCRWRRVPSKPKHKITFRRDPQHPAIQRNHGVWSGLTEDQPALGKLALQLDRKGLKCPKHDATKYQKPHNNSPCLFSVGLAARFERLPVITASAFSLLAN